MQMQYLILCQGCGEVVDARGDAMCANPSYIRFGKLNFPAITACERKAYRVLSFTCESALVNEGLFRGDNWLLVCFQLMECILRQG